MDSWIVPAFWLALGVLMLVVEVATVSLVSLWFALGALAAFVLSLLHVPFWAQLLTFASVSAVLFFLLKGKIQEFFRFRHDRSGAVSILGRQGTVTRDIDTSGNGRVSIAGQDWKASADRPIASGSAIRAVSLSGVTLKVQALDKEEPSND